MAARSLELELELEDAAWAQVPPPPVATAAGGWSIPSDEAAPARATGRAHLVTRGLSEFYLWFAAVLVVWALVPAAVGMAPVLITSGSMQPHVTSGDVVVIGGAVDHPVETGSVVTFRDPAGSGQLITHRVTDRNDDGTYQTRGDANPTPDSTPVPPDHVEGVGRLLVPAVGLPALWLRTGELGLFALWAGVTVAALAGAFMPAPASGGRQRSGGWTQPRGPRSPRGSALRPAWASAATMSLSTVTVLSLAALSVAAFSGTTATAGDWTAGLPAPENVQATPSCEEELVGGVLQLVIQSVTVTWEHPSGDTSNVTHYEVYRSTDAGGPYDHQAQVDAGTTSYEDSSISLTTGDLYYVVRSSNDSSGWESPNSNEAAAVC